MEWPQCSRSSLPLPSASSRAIRDPSGEHIWGCAIMLLSASVCWRRRKWYEARPIGTPPALAARAIWLSLSISMPCSTRMASAYSQTDSGLGIGSPCSADAVLAISQNSGGLLGFLIRLFPRLLQLTGLRGGEFRNAARFHLEFMRSGLEVVNLGACPRCPASRGSSFRPVANLWLAWVRRAVGEQSRLRPVISRVCRCCTERSALGSH